MCPPEVACTCLVCIRRFFQSDALCPLSSHNLHRTLVLEGHLNTLKQWFKPVLLAQKLVAPGKLKMRTKKILAATSALMVSLQPVIAGSINIGNNLAIVQSAETANILNSAQQELAEAIRALAEATAAGEGLEAAQERVNAAEGAVNQAQADFEAAQAAEQAAPADEGPKAEEAAPVAEELKAEEAAPVAEELKADETVVEEAPSAEEAVPAADEQRAEKAAPVAEEPKVQETVVEEAPKPEEALPTAEKPSVEEAAPTAEKPSVEEAAPAAEEPKAEAPKVEDKPAAAEDIAAPTDEVTVKEPLAEAAPVAEQLQAADEKPITVLPETISQEDQAALVAAEQKRREQARERRNELLGAAAVGAVVGALVPLLGGKLVEDQGDRVVVERNGEYFIRKDENALLRRDGVQVYYEELPNGLSRETMTRPNGVQIITTRAPNGEVLRRERVFPNGEVTVLIDSLDQRGRPRVNYDRELPPLNMTIDQHLYIVSAQEADRDAISRTFLAPPVETLRESYSLRDVRSSERLRESVRRLDLDAVQFDSGSSTVRESQIPKLENIAFGIADVLNENPSAVFLIEGHTDAVGGEIYNLALSDRRAETIARILIDSYGLPPENFVVEGYGEAYLKIPTEADEPRNRRVAIRNITSLLTADN